MVEGGSDTYTVKLSSQPAGDVTVTVSGHAGTDVSISGSSLGAGVHDVLTFTTTDWNEPQSDVTVIAAEDFDAVADADVVLTHTVASVDDAVYDALSALGVTVSITENDSAGVVISRDGFTVVEGGTDILHRQAVQPARRRCHGDCQRPLWNRRVGIGLLAWCAATC